jgi:hypothetical protein
MDKTFATGRNVPHSIHLAIAEHGALRVMGAALATLLGPVFALGAPDPTAHLNDHMRKDIGLPPRGSPLPEAPMLPVRW